MVALIHAMRTLVPTSFLLMSVVLAMSCGPPPEEAAAAAAEPSDVQLAINEVMPRNDVTLADSDGENDDWIEIKNLGDTDIALDGFTLGDSAGSGAFPDGAVVPAGGFLIVFADDSLDSGTPEEPHFPFKLSGDGDKVELLDSAGAIVDGFDVPALDVDVSYGRVPDGTGDPRALTPTPRAANDS